MTRSLAFLFICVCICNLLIYGYVEHRGEQRRSVAEVFTFLREPSPSPHTSQRRAADIKVSSYFNAVVEHRIVADIVQNEPGRFDGPLTSESWCARHFYQMIVWRRHRKMMIQLLSVSALYFILYMPPTFVELMQLCCIVTSFGAEYQLHAILFSYYVICLFPFLTAITLSGPALTLRKLFSSCKKQSVHPATTTT